MDFQTILSMVLTSGIVGVIVERGTAIRFRKQIKTIKDSEAAKSTIEAQSAEVDLISKIKEEFLSMVEVVKKSNEQNFINQDQIIRKLEDIDDRMSMVERYLNGGLQKYIKEHPEEN